MDRNIYIFVNKSRNMIKLLRFEGDGFAIYFKRLEKGRIELPQKHNIGTASLKISHATVMMMLEGIGLENEKIGSDISLKTVFN